MSEFSRREALAVGTGALLVPLGLRGGKASSSAILSYRGASIRPVASDTFATPHFAASLRDLRNTGANTCLLVIQVYQHTKYSSTFHDGTGDGLVTPSPTSVVRGVELIHQHGMKAFLSFHPEVDDRSWRAGINAHDRQGWYKHYFGQIKRFLAHSGADGCVLGSEIHDMMAMNAGPQAPRELTNQFLFNQLIGRIRSIFRGIVTYDSNQGGSYQDGLNIDYSKLDMVLTSFYPAQSGSTIGAKVYPAAIRQYLAGLHGRYPHKPLLLGEAGFRSVLGADKQPPSWTLTGPYDPALQAHCYQALFNFVQTVPYLDGVMIWDWRSVPGGYDTNATDYTPQGKPAQHVMSGYFKTGSMPNPWAINFSTGTKQINGTTAQPVGAAITISTNEYLPTGQSQVDLEVQSAGKKVGQTTYQGLTLDAGKSYSYELSPWTPTVNGDYGLFAGVFINNWTRELAFRQVAKISVHPPSNATYITSAATSTPVVPIGVVPSEVLSVMSPVSLANVIVDLETWDSEGNKVDQRYLEGQDLSAGVLATLSPPATSWTPVAGSYTLKVGLFEAGWVGPFSWNDDAGEFTGE